MYETLAASYILTSESIADLLNPNPPRDQILEEKLLELASEGIALRTALHGWSLSFKDWLSIDPTRLDDSRSVFANIQFHAISIYLSGHFDYRYQYKQIATASLPDKDIQVHVHEILQQTEAALKSTHLAGILFFFPLRNAGARARSAAQRGTILLMLRQIAERSFASAQAFSEDLRSLWGDVAL